MPSRSEHGNFFAVQTNFWKSSSTEDAGLAAQGLGETWAGALAYHCDNKIPGWLARTWKLHVIRAYRNT